MKNGCMFIKQIEKRYFKHVKNGCGKGFAVFSKRRKSVHFFNMAALRPSFGGEMLNEIQAIQSIQRTGNVTPLKDEIEKLKQKSAKLLTLCLKNLLQRTT